MSGQRVVGSSVVRRFAVGCLLCAGWLGIGRPGWADEPLDPATRMVHATLKLFHPRSTATGFLVEWPASRKAGRGECALVTAHHVLDQTAGETLILVLRKREADGKYSRLDHTIPVRKQEKPLWARHPKHDVAVLPVTLPEGTAVTPLPYSVLVTEATLRRLTLPVGSRVLALSYPVRFEANGAGFPVARQAGLASFPLLPIEAHPHLLLDMNAFVGDSGGPVFALWRDAAPAVAPADKVSAIDNRVAAANSEAAANLAAAEGDAPPATDLPIVLGLVTGQVRNDEKVQTLFEERSVHHPLGLAVVVQAHWIRETIELANAAPAPAAKPSE
ncbi:MAG: trypsin-like peptidase domain-containing protein [Pirellulales bacterium]